MEDGPFEEFMLPRNIAVILAWYMCAIATREDAEEVSAVWH